ncbi:uncharacterized protein LOC100178531 isoform X2 [Ciona intestinalis]
MRVLLVIATMYFIIGASYSIEEVCTKWHYKCVFPFEYKNQLHNSCLPYGTDTWCGIKPVITENERGIDFDYCSADCPKTDIRCTANHRCVLPFELDGKNITRCQVTYSGYEWCPITKDYKGAGAGIDWDYCVESCSEDLINIQTTTTETTTTPTDSPLIHNIKATTLPETTTTKSPRVETTISTTTTTTELPLIHTTISTTVPETTTTTESSRVETTTTEIPLIHTRKSTTETETTTIPTTTEIATRFYYSINNCTNNYNNNNRISTC